MIYFLLSEQLITLLFAHTYFIHRITTTCSIFSDTIRRVSTTEVWPASEHGWEIQGTKERAQHTHQHSLSTNPSCRDCRTCCQGNCFTTNIWTGLNSFTVWNIRYIFCHIFIQCSSFFTLGGHGHLRSRSYEGQGLIFINHLTC